jgi:hypothetical protein
MAVDASSIAKMVSMRASNKPTEQFMVETDTKTTPDSSSYRIMRSAWLPINLLSNLQRTESCETRFGPIVWCRR